MKANSDELITFVTVVESGSFSRAAERLDQANSVVSRTVKKLETKLGVTLLNRTTRQISLTQEGENYFRQVQKVLSDMAAAENALMESRQRPQGLLRVDAATPVVLHVLTPLVAEFRALYPEMSLSLVSSENFINLIERKVDIAIRVGELTDSSLKARKLMTSYRQILASPAQQHGIAITSYMTLAYGKALQDETIKAIAARRNATPAQVILAWALQLGYAVIPSSTKRENLASNLLAQQLTLTAEEMAEIATLENNGRLVSPEGLAPNWD